MESRVPGAARDRAAVPLPGRTARIRARARVRLSALRYLLDTNVCVDYLRGDHPSVIRRIQRASPDDLCVSSIVVAELRYGAAKSADPRGNDERLSVFLRDIPCLNFDSDAAAMYGRVRAGLEDVGSIIGPYDLQIAAHAMSLGLVLVTDYVREFRRVRGLRVENWRRGMRRAPAR